MTRTYLLRPGYVRSATDGDQHFIAAGQLAHLYGVPISRCYVLPSDFASSRLMQKQRSDLLARTDLVHLGPRADGDYRLPKPRRRNGCHNRAPYRETVELRERDGTTVAAFPFRMATDCQYTLTALGRADDGCLGCSWRAPQ